MKVRQKLKKGVLSRNNQKSKMASSSDEEENENRSGASSSSQDDSDNDSGSENGSDNDSDRNNDNDDDSDNSSSDGDDDDAQNDATAMFKEEESDDDEEDGGDSDDGDGQHGASTPTNAASKEALTYDLRNLVSINTHQISNAALYDSKRSNNNSSSSDTDAIEIDTSPITNIDEEYIYNKATSDCTKLIEELWKLPIEQSDAGPMVTLPSYDEVALPRALPPPPPKQETKWEKFAKAKGISLNKEKRSRKVFDEATGEWMYRTGYEKANSKEQNWPIVEVGANDDPFDDPWEKMRDEKRSRKDKNTANRMKNAEQAGQLTKGTTNRTIKSMERKRKAGKEGGNADRDNPLPSGVPVDLKKSQDGQLKLRGKESTIKALVATQRSTASLGKFDKMREGEPERKKSLSKLKKRRVEQSTGKNVVATEGERGMKILKSVIAGGGMERERARKKGALATGETAYDYEYSDGLGASSFRKKKGRAGAGKMKKMTKKRIV